MQPQVIRRKRHEHGAHAKVDPAGSIQIAHARINEREAGLTFAPGFKVTLIKVVFAQTVAAPRPYFAIRWPVRSQTFE